MTRILIVEDEAIVAADLHQVLKDLGYEVLGVLHDAEDAVSRALKERPDLILMDIRLRGDPDGIDAAIRIREESRIPVVFLTAHADDVTLQRSKAAAPYGYVTKPFNERSIHSAIQIALHRREVEPQYELLPGAMDFARGPTDGFFLLNREWRFSEVSSTAAKLLGSTPETMIGAHLWEKYPELEDSILYDACTSAREEHRTVALDDLLLPSRRRVRVRVEPSGVSLRVVLILQPVEER